MVVNRPPEGERHDRALWFVGILAAALLAGAIALLILTSTDEVPTYGPSMRPTLGTNEPIRLDTDAYGDDQPQIGDVVALQGPRGFNPSICAEEHPPGSPCPLAGEGYGETRLIKRVVGEAGDTIAFNGSGRVIRNGTLASEPFILRCPGTCALPVPIEVPADHLFVAGDNRPKSSDSRIWGSVPVEAVDGRVILDP